MYKYVILVSDFMARLATWYSALSVFIYNIYLVYFAPNTRILYAIGGAMNGEREKYDITRHVINFYRFSRVLSCASLYRWLKSQTQYNIEIVSLIYKCEITGRAIAITYNLNDDLYDGHRIQFDSPKNEIPDYNISLGVLLRDKADIRA